MMSFAPVRGHRSRRGGWRRPSLTNASPTTMKSAPPFGDVLSKVRLTDLDKSAREIKDTAVIRNVVSIASFNWQCASKPTIVVPGMLLSLVESDRKKLFGSLMRSLSFLAYL